MATEHEELKTTLNDLGKAWKDFRDNNDNLIAKKAAEVGTGLIKEAEVKLNAKIDELIKQKNDLQLAINRMSTTQTKDGKVLPEDYEIQRKSYEKFLRKGASNGGNNQEWTPEDAEKKSLSVVSDADGGYTVHADMNGRIIKRIYETSPIRDLANVITIGTDAIEGLVDQDQVASGWVGEQGSRPQTATATFGRWRIPVHEQYAMPAATQKVLDDSNMDIEAWLAEKIAEKFGRVENTAFVVGDGSGKPKGFLSYGSSSATNTPQGSVEQWTSAGSGAITFDDLIAVQYRLKSYYRGRAVWGMNRGSIGYTRTLKNSFGNYLWEPGLQVGAPDRLLGAPVVELNDMPDIAASALSIIYADWKEFYQIVDRAGIRVLRDPYTAKGYVLFYTTKRVGGDVLNFEAGKILKVHA